MNEHTGENLNDTTITEEQEGTDWRACEDDSAEYGEYAGETV